MEVTFRGVAHRRHSLASFALIPLLAVLSVYIFAAAFLNASSVEPSSIAYDTRSEGVQSPPAALDKKFAYESYLPDTAGITPPSPGLAPAVLNIPTSQPVIFITIDDGWTKKPEALNWLADRHIPFTMFLTDDAIKDNLGYFKTLQQSGGRIENHTLSHPMMTKLTYDQQKAEICGQADKLAAEYGSRPTLFRPPYGSYNTDTQRAAADCGMRAVVLWKAKADGGNVQFQDNNTALHPGDILLLHFRPQIIQDLNAIMNEAAKQNLVVANLQDWL